MKKPCHCCRGTGQENDHVAIGKNLRKLRESKGIKQLYVAEKLNVSQAYLSDLEAGRRRWSEVMIKSYKQVVEG